MRRIILSAVAIAAAVFTVSCKHRPLGPEEVDTSVPPPTSVNEPAGFTPIANRGFANLEEDNWIYGGDQGAWLVREEADAPQSRPSVGRITFPAGFPSGASPIHLERNLRSNDHWYMNTWFRVSENWKHNQIFDAIAAIWAGDQPRLFIGWRADESGKLLRPTGVVATDKVEGGTLWLDPNLVTDVSVEANKWHHIELEVETATGTGGLGRFVVWFDGVKITSYDNVPFGLVEQKRHWGMIQVGPSWGGLTEPLNQSQWLELDHVYLSAPK